MNNVSIITVHNWKGYISLAKISIAKISQLQELYIRLNEEFCITRGLSIFIEITIRLVSSFIEIESLKKWLVSKPFISYNIICIIVREIAFSR